MSGGRLLVVATPIGNLGDMSQRSIEALRSAVVVLAEDTRRTRPLLEHIGATGKLVSCHQHNEEQRVPWVIERVQAGELVALVTDAGAPGVSDPGGRVVDAVAGAGLDVEVLPGPSAVVAALMGAGLVSHRFWFVGFLPRKSGPRRKLLEHAPDDCAVVIFEAPARVAATLEDMHAVFGERRVVVARELTKKFETFHRGVLGGELSPPVPGKGEIVIVMEAGSQAPAAVVDEDAVIVALLADESLTPKQRAKRLAADLGISGKDAYARLEARKGGPAAESPAESPAPTPVTAADFRARLMAAAKASAPARRRLVAALATAAEALLEADAATAEVFGGRAAEPKAGLIGSEIPGADALMEWLEAAPALPAPTEAKETARALLNAMGSADLLDDAIETIAGDLD